MLIIPGKLITTATLTMALLYIANGKHDLQEMINETRAVALCLKDAHSNTNTQTSEDTRNTTEDFEDKMEEVAHRCLDVLSEGMAKAKEQHQQIINNAVKKVRANTTITLNSTPLLQKVDNLSNTLLTTTDTL